jgi:hypothetical protein
VARGQEQRQGPIERDRAQAGQQRLLTPICSTLKTTDEFTPSISHTPSPGVAANTVTEGWNAPPS